jgi:UDP-N-acetylmuramoylalanine--D-glutamate ligase
MRSPGADDERGLSSRARATPRVQAELWDRFRDDVFLIVGFSERTGLAVATELEAQGVRFRISDLEPLETLRPLLAGLKISSRDVLTGPQSPAQLEGVTRVILSPGVPRSIPLIVEADRRGIPVYSDVDFLFDFIGHKPVIAITGTDGKTTTTALAGEIIGSSARVVVAGNIGVPVFSKYREILDCDLVVLEMSSFMLERLYRFRPWISAVLNIAEDHVDRYASPGEYAKAKLNIFSHCTPDDLFIYNLDDPVLSGHVPAHLQVRTISSADRSADYFFAEGSFHFCSQSVRQVDCLLRGVHNRENILTAVAIACEAGIEPARIAPVLARFGGLPHRFEYLGKLGGVDVYNDSKATTVHAVERALESLERNICLIMGGREKDLDFSSLKKHAPRIKHLVCYGEAGERIRRALDLESSEYVARFEDAVERAAVRCTSGDTLILSPGCTSWDQFENYEARGAFFRELVTTHLPKSSRASSEP